MRGIVTRWFFYLTLSLLLNFVLSNLQTSPWTWVCRKERCTKVLQRDLNGDEKGYPLPVCKLNCQTNGTIWPHPTVKVELGKSLFAFCPNNMKLEMPEAPSSKILSMLQSAINIFKHYLLQMHLDYFDGATQDSLFPNTTGVLSKNKLTVNISVAHPFDTLSVDTDEGYLISVIRQDDQKTVVVNILANTYFGARHALETLSQLIAFDETQNCFQIVDQVLIQDKPVFKYRGVLLDTSRNYFPVSTIERIIDGLSFNKLNMFHWHLTDTHSFPLYLKSVPKITKYGAYSPRKIYTAEDVKSLIHYANIRGVKIIPEFDAPAHVGNGWQWGPEEGKGELAVCVNKEPWQKYCVEPPCGQLNPANEFMYQVLGDVYKDFMEIFENDLFHMGGDEVNLNCWNSSADITSYLTKKGQKLSRDSYIQLWSEFQSRALSLLQEQSSNENITAILWTSDLTNPEHALEYLNPENYIIQIWSRHDDPVVPFLVRNGYRVIFSNYDAWYLDCGYGAWIGGGPLNWCAPYKGWQQVYDNSPVNIIRESVGNDEAEEILDKGLVLGGEAALWTEQADSSAAESKIFPRASALGERLWSNPETTWKVAQSRFVHNRQRFVERGLNPDRIQPEWCHQNEGLCYLG